MRDHKISLIVIGCLVISSLAIGIYGATDPRGRRAVQVFLAAAVAIVVLWLTENPQEIEPIMERMARWFLEFPRRF